MSSFYSPVRTAGRSNGQPRDGETGPRAAPYLPAVDNIDPSLLGLSGEGSQYPMPDPKNVVYDNQDFLTTTPHAHLTGVSIRLGHEDISIDTMQGLEENSGPVQSYRSSVAPKPTDSGYVTGKSFSSEQTHSFGTLPYGFLSQRPTVAPSNNFARQPELVPDISPTLSRSTGIPSQDGQPYDLSQLEQQQLVDWWASQTGSTGGLGSVDFDPDPLLLHPLVPPASTSSQDTPTFNAMSRNVDHGQSKRGLRDNGGIPDAIETLHRSKRPRITKSQSRTVPQKYHILLSFYLGLCEGRTPTEDKIHHLAGLLDVDEDAVRAWFSAYATDNGDLPAAITELGATGSRAPDADARRVAFRSRKARARTPNQQVAHGSTSAPKPEFLAKGIQDALGAPAGPNTGARASIAQLIHEEAPAIKQHVDESRRDHSASSQVKSLEGKLRCTHGCRYRTDRRNQWERHEELSQPQQFWSCAECRKPQADGTAKRYICTRKDKMLKHAQNRHFNGTDQSEIAKTARYEKAESLRDNSQVPYQASFEDHCAVEGCGTRFLTWKLRNDHIIREEHYNQHPPRRATSLNTRPELDSDDQDSDDDTDDSDDDSRGGGRPRRYRAFQESSRSDGAGFSIQPSENRSTKTMSAAPGSSRFACSIQTRLDQIDLHRCGPRRLIDVDNWCLSSCVPKVPRFLILSDERPCDITKSGYTTQDSLAAKRVTGALKNIKLPATYSEALRLTRRLGFQHLWIDSLCVVQDDPDERKYHSRIKQSLLEQASLVVVIANSPKTRYSTHGSLHFACHHKEAQMVRTWARQEICFRHVQLLGHGAYSVVDKVSPETKIETLLPKETFARKIVLRTVKHDRENGYLPQEVEIMQKLRHQHIVQFVAAYYDQKSSLNILIRPVAECDLRQFLERPDLWPRVLVDIERWFTCLASALSYMHSNMIKHKDVKPANILISSSEVYLSDFGTSRDFSATESGTSGSALMTPRYCAPEVAAEKYRGRSADVFSLGCVFAEMLTVLLGRPLSDMHQYLGIADNTSDRCSTYHQHLSGLYVWLRLLDDMTHVKSRRKVIHVCQSMLAYEPSERPAAALIVESLCPDLEKHRTHTSQCCGCAYRSHKRVLKALQRHEALASDLLPKTGGLFLDVSDLHIWNNLISGFSATRFDAQHRPLGSSRCPNLQDAGHKGEQPNKGRKIRLKVYGYIVLVMLSSKSDAGSTGLEAADRTRIVEVEYLKHRSTPGAPTAGCYEIEEETGARGQQPSLCSGPPVHSKDLDGDISMSDHINNDEGGATPSSHYLQGQAWFWELFRRAGDYIGSLLVAEIFGSKQKGNSQDFVDSGWSVVVVTCFIHAQRTL